MWRRGGWVVGLLGVMGASHAPVPGDACPAKSIPSTWGPVPVECVVNLEVEGDPVYGAFFPLERRIRLRAGLPREFLRGVLEHESCHVALHDASLDPPPPIAEQICDAIAMQRMGRS